MLLIQQDNCRVFLIDTGNGQLHSNVASMCSLHYSSPLLSLFALLMFLPLQIVEKVQHGWRRSKQTYFVLFLIELGQEDFCYCKSGEGQRAILV